MRLGKKILVVDDNKAWRRNLRGKLSGEYDVDTTTPDDDEFERLINENVYDLIILDVMMPIKSGQEVFEEVRAFDQRCRIVALSNLSDDSADAKYFIDRSVPFYSKGEGDYIGKIKAYLNTFEFKDPEDLSVLIVDDDQFKRNTYIRLLREKGITDIEFCVSLDEAARLVAARNFDVYLIDICFREHGRLVPKGWQFISMLSQENLNGSNVIIPISTECEAKESPGDLAGAPNLHTFLLDQPVQFGEKISDILLRGPFLVQHV